MYLSTPKVSSQEEAARNKQKTLNSRKTIPGCVLLSATRSDMRIGDVSSMRQRFGQERLARGMVFMKGSITFDFDGDSKDYRVHISRLGELDCDDLEVIVALLNEDIMLKKSIESGKIKPTSWDPTGRAQLRDAWSN